MRCHLQQVHALFYIIIILKPNWVGRKCVQGPCCLRWSFQFELRAAWMSLSAHTDLCEASRVWKWEGVKSSSGRKYFVLKLIKEKLSIVWWKKLYFWKENLMRELNWFCQQLDMLKPVSLQPQFTFPPQLLMQHTVILSPCHSPHPHLHASSVQKTPRYLPQQLSFSPSSY